MPLKHIRNSGGTGALAQKGPHDQKETAAAPGKAEEGGAAGPPSGTREISDRHRYLFFAVLGIALILLAFLFNTPGEIWTGSLVILASPANLLTDYFQLANIGATFVNVGLMLLLSIGVAKINGAKMTGAIGAAVFTVAGFAFFGKNLYNSMPIVLGVYVYARLVRLPFNRFLLQSLFGTALSPLVSEFSFNIGLPLLPGIALGIGAGMLAGFVLPPLSIHFLRFHQGFNIYNIGFTAGIVGMFFMAVLRGYGITIGTVSILSSGNNAAFSLLLYGLFGILLLCGLWANRWRLTGYRKLLALSGVLATDFVAISGTALTVINMAFLGLLSTTYVLLLGGELTGPVIGGIFTVVGFGAFGKHVKNVAPILAGVFLANLFYVHDMNSATALLGALFGTTLAPIAGHYGPVHGIVAGMLHMAMVSNVGYLHAGMNLYNNGFSGGFIAAALCPLFDALAQAAQLRQKRAPEDAGGA